MFFFMRFPMISLIFVYKYIENNICSLTIPKLRAINKFPDIKWHSSITATHNFYTLGLIMLKLLDSKIRLGMTSLFISISNYTVLYSGS